MSRLSRFAALVYGVVCYAIFFGSFLYLIGFLGNLVVPRSVDVGPAAPIGVAFVVNAALLLLFGLQHSVMARPGFKAAWTRIVPRPVERSTYVLATSLCLILLYWAWRPIPVTVFDLSGTVAGSALTGLFFAGFGTVLVTTFLIDHFDLFGLRQVVLYFRGRDYTEKRFVTPGPYRWIRHPLYVGWMLAFWATPTLTGGRLLFAAIMTTYILVAIRYEERDLSALLGEPYRRWRDRTPMFVPRVGASDPSGQRAPQAS